MKIGVLGGSFNPPTIAHIELSKKCIESDLCEKVIWVPVNDSYRKATNIGSKERVDMVKLALKDEKDISYSLHELRYDRIVRTAESMEILQKDMPNDELFFIAGADKLVLKWMQKETFISHFGYILVNRGNVNCDEIINSVPVLKKHKTNIKVLDYYSDVSSTMVRDDIRSGKNSSLINPSVLDYIKSHKLFV